MASPSRIVPYALSLFASAALLPDASAQVIAADAGYGNDVRIQVLALDVPICPSCPLAAPTHTSLALENAVFAMQGHRPREANGNLFGLGETLLLRYAWPRRDGWLYAEDGLGVRLVSHTRLYDERRLSTAFQFGELLGVGVRFGRGGAYEAGLRIQHMSNADIKEPNDGVTFTSLRLAWHWHW